MQKYFSFMPDDKNIRGFIFLEFHIWFESYVYLAWVIELIEIRPMSILAEEHVGSRLYQVAVRLESLDKIKCRAQEND